MSPKLFISCCITTFFFSFFCLATAQENVNALHDYFFSSKRDHNFSYHALLPKGSVALFSENQFLIKEMCTASVSGHSNYKENAVAMKLSHFGYSKYGELRWSAGYTRLFAKKVAVGLQVYYILQHAESYQKLQSFTFDLSLYGRISSNIGLGVSVFNPANLKYGISGKEKIPIVFNVMLDYKLSKKLLLAVSGSKTLPGAFDIGASLFFREKFYGFNTDISIKKTSFIFSFWWKDFQIDTGGNFNYRLGFSPQLMLIYHFY